MPSVTYGNTTHQLLEGESVLDGLLRNGIQTAHACKAGSCGSCMLRAAEGAVPERAQAGLKDSWKAQGYFLACVCIPESSIEITDVGADARMPGRITAIDRLSHDVIQVRIRPGQPLEFRAGQYLTLIRDAGLARSYSMASLPGEGELQLHVRQIPGGKMSGWLTEPGALGAEIELQGPAGECFYVPGRPEQPILLAGTGTGLAPLWGIARDALRHGHHGPIHLFHGALQPAGLYLRNELRALAENHSNFRYSPAVLAGPEDPEIIVSPIDSAIAARHPNLATWRGYVCGDPALVRSLKKKFFLAGMALRDISADAFLPSA